MNMVALIKNGLVTNVILTENPYHPDAGVEAIALPDNSQVGIGWAYANGQFTAPQPPTPEPDWGSFRVAMATLPSYLTIASAMEGAAPVALQQLQIAIAANPPNLQFVISLWNALIATGLTIPTNGVDEWNAIAIGANVPLKYAVSGTLGEAEP